MIVIPDAMPARDRARLDILLDRMYAFGGNGVMTLRAYIASGRIVSKETFTDLHSARRIGLEYKELAKSKVTYVLNASDGTSIDVAKLVYDVVIIGG